MSNGLFNKEQLAMNNGQNGNPAYVAVNGIVYDVSSEPSWLSGSHFGLKAGTDLTNRFSECHPNALSLLNRLPKVGIYRDE